MARRIDMAIRMFVYILHVMQRTLHKFLVWQAVFLNVKA
jgi:hypothetical protein